MGNHTRPDTLPRVLRVHAEISSNASDMDYELAKRLKDAGFPQDKCEWYFAEKKGDGNFVRKEKRKGVLYRSTAVACPTLGELIEACGTAFTGITVEEGAGVWPYWKACGERNGDKYEVSKASAPEIAMAHLWMLINHA